MTRGPVRLALYVAIAVLYGLHNDLFLWDDARRVLGLPVGLTYHVAYCFAAAGLMALLVVFGWPDELEAPSHDEERKTAP